MSVRARGQAVDQFGETVDALGELLVLVAEQTITVLRLTMTSPISWSRSASVLVSAAVWVRKDPMVAPCPCSALINWPDNALI